MNKNLFMRFLIIFLLLYSMEGQASQLQHKIHLTKENITLGAIFSSIKKQTGLNIIWQTDKVDTEKIYNVDFKGITFERIWDELNLGSNLTYTLYNNSIVLKIKEEKKNQAKITLQGTVTDKATGKTMSGVSVVLEKTGTIITSVTDQKGNFLVSPKTEGNFNLTVSYMGYVKQKTEIRLDFNKPVTYNVQLVEEAITFDDVVVTGYQIINRREQTAAITSLKAEDILVPGMTSIDQALEGRVPEMLVMNNSGEVGATPRLRVRGTSTILGNREPLWVLDGWPLTDPVDITPEELNNPDYVNIIGNAIAGINPQDIDRIDILKDAAATALYGTRAANGVIVVTTKKGVEGKTTINYNHTSKITRRPRYTDRAINLMNSQERVEVGRGLANMHYRFSENMAQVGYEGALYRHYQGDTDYEEFLREVKWYETVNTDWFDLLTKDAYSHLHTLDVSGGSKSIRFYGSLGYDKDDGVSRTTYSDRYSMRMNLDGNITDKLKMSFRMSGNTMIRNHIPSAIKTIDYAYNTTRALPAFNDDGSYFYYRNTASSIQRPRDVYNFNILNEIDNASDSYNGSSINSSLDLRYTLSPMLEISASGNYSRSTTKQELWWGEKSNYVTGLRNAEYGMIPPKGDVGLSQLPYGGILNTTNSLGDSFGFRTQMDYRRYFGEESNHLISSSLGFEVRSSTNESYRDEAYGFNKDRGLQFFNGLTVLDDYPLYKIWLNQNHRSISNGLSNVVSGYMTTSYSFKELFTLALNGRTDYSNNFGSRSNEKFLPVWAVSGMWNPKNTFKFESNVISDIRLQGSLGKQGNMLPDQSPNLIMKIGVLDQFYNENTSTITRFPNPNLRWEQTTSINTSLNLSLFNSRLNLSGTYYYKHTEDCFTPIKVSTVNGIQEYIMNNGQLINSGYSVTLGFSPVRSNDFSWYFYTMYSGNKNKVEVTDLDSYEYGDYLSGRALVSGEPVSTFYSYNFLGLNPTNGLPTFEDLEDRKHLLVGKTMEETIKLTMLNSGTREPIFNGSFSNTFGYKSLSVSMNMTYSLGSKVRLFPLYSPVVSGIKAESNIRKEFSDRWQTPGDELYTIIPTFVNPADPNFAYYGSHFSQAINTDIMPYASSLWEMYDNGQQRVVSGNYLKMSMLSIRYNMREKLLSKTPFKRVGVSFNTMNLFTIGAKELKGQDPSQAGFAASSLSIRPAYTFQFNISF
jgi:TonB-linked SusC/RagA family outer membrane protein